MNQETGISAVFLPLISVFTVVLAFLALQDASYVASGTVFEYPSQAPYAALAMAEQIFVGNAIDPLQVPSIYPLLLLPFVGEEIQRYLPFAWNIIGLVVAAWIWGRILTHAEFRSAALPSLLALIGPLALPFVSTAFIGTVHILYVASSLAIISGLIQVTWRGPVGKLLVFGVTFAPLLRPEGFLLAGLAVGLVLLWGRFRDALVLAVLAAAPAVTIAFLAPELGFAGLLDWAQAALIRVSERGPSFWLRPNIWVTVVFLALLAAVGIINHRYLFITVMAAIVGAVHLLTGMVTAHFETELFALVVLAAVLVVAASGSFLLSVLTLLPIGFAAAIYVPLTLNGLATLPPIERLSHGELARLAKSLDVPVAIPQLSRVAWQNPAGVVLIADRRDTTAPLVFVPQGSGAVDWTLLGQLHIEGAPDRTTDILATGNLRFSKEIAAWAAGLPEGASYQEGAP